jgi:hypothetical protein
MTSALAVAAVTAVIRNLLDGRLITRGVTANLGGVTVSALPPDRVPIGADERSQLNIFLHRLTPNSSWRSARSTSNSRSSQYRPLAIDLHYLVTAYGEQDFHAEILLGHAMQVLQEIPVLSRDAIRDALTAVAPTDGTAIVSSGRAVLGQSNLADQLDEISISPEFLNSDESSRLWSALQAYRVSSVLITGDN